MGHGFRKIYVSLPQSRLAMNFADGQFQYVHVFSVRTDQVPRLCWGHLDHVTAQSLSVLAKVLIAR